MIDFHLLGNAFEGPDFEWAAFNPQGFQYGRGGKHMRTDAMSSQVAPSFVLPCTRMWDYLGWNVWGGGPTFPAPRTM